MSSAVVVPGRYRLCIAATDATGNSYDSSKGEIELGGDGSVHGFLSDGPITEGSFRDRKISFTLLYNGSLPYMYELDLSSEKAGEDAPGTWALLKQEDEVPLDHEKGTFACETWECIQTSEECGKELLENLPGNAACRVRHTTSVPVPCSMCGLEDGTSRLSFFEMNVPNFGTAELISFSCGGCRYRFNKLNTTEPAKPYGKTLSLHVNNKSLLDRAVVITDSAVVRCPDIEMEMRVGTGRYTTTEGILRGCVSSLKNAGICSTAEKVRDDGKNPIDEFESRVERLIDDCRSRGKAFRIEIHDPLGLSHMEGAETSSWTRTPEQDAELGLVASLYADTAAVFSSDKAHRDDKSTMRSSVSPSIGDADRSELLKACEAMAAECTKEYLGKNDDDETNNEHGLSRGGDAEQEYGGLYAGCD